MGSVDKTTWASFNAHTKGVYINHDRHDESEDVL